MPTDHQTNNAVVFMALMPDPCLNELVQSFKVRTREIAGPQLYLDDPAHLTAYLAVFSQNFRGIDVVRDEMRRIAPLRVRLVGWHSWVGDPLTGRNTLVCQIHPDDKRELRSIQKRLVDKLATYRDRAATLARLAPRLPALTEEQRRSVDEAGFPYLGEGWEPHVTVASIEPTRWSEVLAALEASPPLGEYTLDRIEEFVLHGVEPVSRETIPLAAG